MRQTAEPINTIDVCLRHPLMPLPLAYLPGGEKVLWLGLPQKNDQKQNPGAELRGFSF